MHAKKGGKKEVQDCRTTKLVPEMVEAMKRGMATTKGGSRVESAQRGRKYTSAWLIGQDLWLFSVRDKGSEGGQTIVGAK